MSEIIIISGPTCSGKTAKSIELAIELGAEIISCDSVQIYRGMDIGSAKATLQERAAVRHWMIDVANPDEHFDVVRYAEQAKLALDDIKRRGKRVIVVGGSGFYLKSWFCAVADFVFISDEIKLESSKIEASGGAQGLAKALLELDKNAAEHLDIFNPRRTKNALERVMATGKSVSELKSDFEKLPCAFGDIKRKFILLDADDEVLNLRIKKRAQAMIEDGLIEETKVLLKHGIEKNPSAFNAIGYRETIAYLASGANEPSSLAEEIALHTRMLVKKQRKFFKTQLPKQT